MKKKIVSVIVVILILSMFPLSAFAATMTSGAETKIGVGDSPVDVAVEPGTNYLWVVNYDGSISIVDPVGQNLIDTINVGLRIRGIIFGSEYAYITAVEGYIEVFDLETRSRDRYIQLTADYPTNMVLSPDEKTLYVTSGIPSEIAITVVDLENDAFSTITSQQGSETSDVVYDQSTGLIYAADKTNSRICVIDTSDNSISSIDTRTLAPVGLVADFANNRLYASSDSEVALIDLTSKLVIDSTTAGKGERIVRTTESRLYATSASSSKMYIFDTSDPDELNLLDSVDVDSAGALAGIAINEARQELYLNDTAGDNVIILKTEKIVSDESLTATGTDKLKLKGTASLGSFLQEDTAEIGYYISTDSKLSPTNLIGTKTAIKTGGDTSSYSFEKTLEGLDPNTTYYVMAYAKS